MLKTKLAMKHIQNIWMRRLIIFLIVILLTVIYGLIPIDSQVKLIILIMTIIPLSTFIKNEAKKSDIIFVVVAFTLMNIATFFLEKNHVRSDFKVFIIAGIFGLTAIIWRSIFYKNKSLNDKDGDGVPDDEDPEPDNPNCVK